MTRPICVFDTETCGFHGPTVLIQYQFDDDPIQLHDVWMEPIWSTLELIERMCDCQAVVGFNLAFDWFKIIQTVTCLELLAEKIGQDADPIDHIETYAAIEPDARDGPCVKPRSALDLLLHARKGPFQDTMDRKSIRIRKVPSQMVNSVINELDRRLQFEEYLFARGKNKKERWKSYPIKDYKTGKPVPGFRDIVLTFRPSAALKVLAKHVLGHKDVLFMKDVKPPGKPLEIGWAPFALALSNASKGWACKVGDKRGYAWPAIIKDHIYHWKFHKSARRYATDDVIYTRDLFDYFGRPEHGDIDSILACQVGASRWRGFKIDEDRIRKLDAGEVQKMKLAPRAPHHVYKYLSAVMSDTEKVAFDEHGSTKKTVLETIGEWPTEAGKRAKEVLDSRQSANKHTLFTKLLQAGRFHASATVIGSLSGRNSGRTESSDGKRISNLNALGIQRNKEIRLCFPLAQDDMQLDGGDFAAFEVSIAEAVYNDPNLRKELLTCSECQEQVSPDDFRHKIDCSNCGASYSSCKNCKGTIVFINGHLSKPCDCGDCIPKSELEATMRKIHGLFAMALWPGTTYNDIVATKGSDDDRYDKGKRAVFGGLLYGGDANTLEKRLGIAIEIGEAAIKLFNDRYKEKKRAEQEIFDAYCSMRQPKGIGTNVEWHDPVDTVSSLNGFVRSFVLENRVCKALYMLATKPPTGWRAAQVKVFRRDRWQSASGAVKSALYAAAFQLQAFNMRAATNHKIQSTGAIICKTLQTLLWKLQPHGISPWVIQPFNVHDELMCPVKKELSSQLEQIVNDYIEIIKELIPLIKMDWSSDMETWAEK